MRDIAHEIGERLGYVPSPAVQALAAPMFTPDVIEQLLVDLTTERILAATPARSTTPSDDGSNHSHQEPPSVQPDAPPPATT